MLKQFLLAISLMAALPATPSLAARAPDVSAWTIDDVSVPERPYDEDADAQRAIDFAMDRARREHKLVLIDLGGNWCPDCRILAGVMELPDVRAFIDARYAVVFVDVGRFDRNLDVPARFGIDGRLEGVPSVLIVTPDGRLVDRGHTAALDDVRAMTPQAIADWLAEWTP